MSCPPLEPSLEEALADPIIRAIMRADKVDPAALKLDLRRVADALDGGRIEPEHQKLDT